MLQAKGEWVPGHTAGIGRDYVPGTPEKYIIRNCVRAEVWRWRDFDRWSWSAVTPSGDYLEARPSAETTFETIELAKAHALEKAGLSR